MVDNICTQLVVAIATGVRAPGRWVCRIVLSSGAYQVILIYIIILRRTVV